MDDSDPLEIALTAIFRVSEIALTLGAKGLQLCHSLGAELFIVWYSLNAPTSEDEESMRELVLKLLRDVERVCSVTVSCPFPPRESLEEPVLLESWEAVAQYAQLPFFVIAGSRKSLWGRLLH
jgi:hypothetical protein